MGPEENPFGPAGLVATLAVVMALVAIAGNAREQRPIVTIGLILLAIIPEGINT
jgi:hypothetical protein